MTRFSRYLDDLRVARRSTLTAVVGRLEARGVPITLSSVSRWFSGHTRPTLGQFQMLALVLDLSIVERTHALALAAEDDLVGPDVPAPAQAA